MLPELRGSSSQGDPISTFYYKGTGRLQNDHGHGKSQVTSCSGSQMPEGENLASAQDPSHAKEAKQRPGDASRTWGAASGKEYSLGSVVLNTQPGCSARIGRGALVSTHSGHSHKPTLPLAMDNFLGVSDCSEFCKFPQ